MAKSALPRIELAKPAREVLARSLSDYLKTELDVEVSGFDAHFLLDFVLERLGPYIYNQALYDAQALIRAKLEALGDAVLDLEKPAKV